VTRVLCLLAAGVAGLVCGWVWGQAELRVVVASVADPHSGTAWFRAGLALLIAGTTALAVLNTRSRP
jgi:hypothetical protein